MRTGCTLKTITTFSPLHDGMQALVIQAQAASDKTLVQNGVKQSCVLTSTLFFSWPGAILEVDFKKSFEYIQGFQAQVSNTHNQSPCLSAAVFSVGHYFYRGHVHASRLRQNNQMSDQPSVNLYIS